MPPTTTTIAMMIHFLENLAAMASHLVAGGAVGCGTVGCGAVVGGADVVGEPVVDGVENKLPQLVRFCISILVASGTNGCPTLISQPPPRALYKLMAFVAALERRFTRLSCCCNSCRLASSTR